MIGTTDNSFTIGFMHYTLLQFTIPEVNSGFRFSPTGGERETVVKSSGITIFERYLQVDQRCSCEVGLLLLLPLLFTSCKCFFLRQNTTVPPFGGTKQKEGLHFLNFIRYVYQLTKRSMMSGLSLNTKASKKKSGLFSGLLRRFNNAR